jgi:Spy/CpxP family protein refolding chaperone
MKDGFESLGRVRAQGLVLLLVSFVVGILGGMALERVRMTRRPPRPPAERTAMRAGMPPMFERLDLTPEQHQRIEAILEQSRPLTDSVLRSSLPRLRAIRDSVRLRIREVLTPEQQERFDEMERRWGDRGPGEWGLPMGPGERGRRGGPGGRPMPEPPPPDSR